MANIEKQRFSRLIKNFEFAELFNDLGWDYVKKREQIAVKEQTYTLDAVAEKKNFLIFVCYADKIPDYESRKKLDNAVTKLYFEHLIILCDNAKKHQIWQLVIREQGKPLVVRSPEYYTHQDPELLFQKLKGLFFSLDEEDKIGILDVKSRIQEQFNTNAEKVTKQFYTSFKDEHAKFLKFIKGITATVDQEWYASLMLNRLMFIYFIQKKGFLNDDKDYLVNKLKMTQQKKGKDKFYSFYRHFLLLLFHKGLASPNRDPELLKEIGNVPYLNGGLFEVHQIEERYKDIEIEDKAFERVFKFFDEFDWHLDTRMTSSGRDINPDVIGHIFEKYINDRASMGAYYTKEDITDYISKNCIIPYLFDEVKKSYPKALSQDTEIWKMLRTDPDKYIYDAVKHGTSVNIYGGEPKEITLEKPLELPAEISIGLDTSKPDLLERRKEWNKPAPKEYALPTEIWREVVERRNRYAEVRGKIEGRGIADINDFITYNLNIRQFAQDAIRITTDPEFLKAFYKALREITILDPTCGSGAFLFAALNVLESLYEGCIDRMEAFVKEGGKGKYKFFEDVLREINAPEHPNLQYYIYKSIILCNLYGVDIMNEAVEIAKLRLFLKLVATVDPDYSKENMGLEPLPDIDFNIRAGNTLIGFTSLEEVERAVEGSFDREYLKTEIESIKENAEYVNMAYKAFRAASIENDQSLKKAKDELRNKLAALNQKLDKYQAQLYGIDAQNKPKLFDGWKDSHQPFHWFSEFYEIISEKKGFDVIIGNPPYVEYSKVKKDYTIKGYQTESCGNLYAFIMERSLNLRHGHGSLGFIVPISLVCTQRMESVQKTIAASSNNIWLSNYAERPSKLFVGAEVLLTIVLSRAGNNAAKYFTTGFTKWASEERPDLFNRIEYQHVQNKVKPYVIGKLSSGIETRIIAKLLASGKQLRYYLRSNSNYPVYYRIGGGRYWKIFTNFQPRFVLNGKKSVSSRENYMYFDNTALRDVAITLLSSSLFYWYFIITTNCRDLNPSDLNEFPINLDSIEEDHTSMLVQLCGDMMADYQKTSQQKEKTSSLTGHIKYQEFYPRLSKPIIDEIDRVLAKHYGFTDEELDFIINYDIKYRMGKELEAEEE